MARYGLNLNRKSKSSKKKPLLIILFLCFTVILGAFSTFLLWRSLDYDFGNILKNGETSTTETPQVSHTEPKNFTGECAFAAVVTDDDKNAVYCAQLICVDLASKTVRVVPVDVSSKISGEIFSDFTQKASGDEIKAAFTAEYGVNVSRYLILTESKYKSLFRMMGDITVNISDDLKYDSDNMYLELARGDNTLSPDKIHKYMRCISDTFDSATAARKHAEICVAALNAYVTQDNFSKADDLFGSLINCFSSDITIVDYTGAKEKIGSLVPQDPKGHIKAFVSDNVRESANEEE